jgi:hypothetical protein
LTIKYICYFLYYLLTNMVEGDVVRARTDLYTSNTSHHRPPRDEKEVRGREGKLLDTTKPRVTSRPPPANPPIRPLLEAANPNFTGNFLGLFE